MSFEARASPASHARAVRLVVSGLRASAQPFAAVGRHWLLLIVVLALVVRLPLLLADGQITPGDGPRYFQLAHRFVDGAGLPGDDFRPPGYPIAITPFVLIGRALGEGEADLLLAFQDLLGIALVLTILAVGTRFFGAPVGVGAALLAALSPVLVPLERATGPDLMFGVAVLVGAALVAEAAIRRVDLRLLVLAGISFGIAAYLKPAGQALVAAPLVALLFSTQGVRRALLGGCVATAVMLLTLSPWLIRNAVHGTAGMSGQGGLTLYHRAFEDDKYPVPRDARYGPLLRRLQVRYPSKPPLRLYGRSFTALRSRGLSASQAIDVQRQVALTAIRRHLSTYVLHTVGDLGQTVGDLGRFSRDPLDGYAPREHLRTDLDAVRTDLVPTGFSWAVLHVGGVLSVLWLILTVHGLAALALPFSRNGNTRIAGIVLLITWLAVALPTALTHGALWRYSAALAPLTWLLGSGGVFVAWSLLRQRWQQRGG
jgi:4-amino-4-deoxy-L-arabinose transferase-like glycosyltransferase